MTSLLPYEVPWNVPAGEALGHVHEVWLGGMAIPVLVAMELWHSSTRLKVQLGESPFYRPIPPIAGLSIIYPSDRGLHRLPTGCRTSLGAFIMWSYATFDSCMCSSDDPPCSLPHKSRSLSLTPP